MAIPPLGAVATPAGFIIQSCEGLVALYWDSVSAATAYYVSRSTDGVSFSELGHTSSLFYQDSTAVLGTIYYYYIQAATVSFSSPATDTLQGLSINPGETTVGNLILQSQQRCDRVNSQFITNQEWTSMISESRKELYDILIQAFGDDYYIATPYTYTTDGGSTLYPLPADFYKLMGVEVALNPSDPNSWVTLKKFEFIQRNLWNYPNAYTFYGITNLRYRLNGTNLMIVPIASANQTLRIWYGPRPSQLINTTDIVDCVSGWEEYIIADCCIKAMAKEESSTQVFEVQKQALLKRITEAANNRDVGEPETVSDSKTRNFAWSDDNGFNGGNGGMS